MNTNPKDRLLRTPLHALHLLLGAKMVPFAGYDMPVQFPTGVLKEHLHTRAGAGLFDVSHMGQRVLVGPDDATVAAALEQMTPGDFQTLGRGRMRYSLLLDAQGGIVDDVMVTRPLAVEGEGTLLLVVNASRKAVDDAFINERLPKNVKLSAVDDHALLALQGPASESVLARHCKGVAALSFMAAIAAKFDGIDCLISRSGYTGEDGFELSVPAAHAAHVAAILLDTPEVLPVGLGARDSLRLEAGLCLYGHDIDETTSPVAAGLGWTIGKRRKMAKDFPAAARIMNELLAGPPRKRVGLRPRDKAPAREGAEIVDAAGQTIGKVTSGGFAPSLGVPIAMGYVDARHADDGCEVALMVRGIARAALVVPLPFVGHRYKRKRMG